MRPILACALLLLGFAGVAPEPEYASLFADYAVRPDDAAATPALLEIETAAARGDRLAIATAPHAVMPISFAPGSDDRPLTLASAASDIDPTVAERVDTANGGSRGATASLDDLCNALYASAQDNDLPIPFFANLIWQESRLRDDAVSPKGALGIAQFMPKVASEKGLLNPLDPLQAIPASARFLRELRLQFGNLGFVAAAYNAGARRVAEWLEHRGTLPRETRSYVVRVTGLSVEAWRSMPVQSDALTFVQRLPCRSLPAFANVEQTQLEEAQSEETKLEQATADNPAVATAAAASAADTHAAAHRHSSVHRAREEAHDLGRRRGREAKRGDAGRRAGERAAAHAPHAGHAKRRSA